jgi:glycine reductase
MATNDVKQLLGEVMSDIAEMIETGRSSRRARVGITTNGSEHGVAELVRGAELAAKANPDIEVVLIGPKVDSALRQEVTDECDAELHKTLERLLDTGAIDACVTMHYSFPIGTSTVGRVITPGRGREMFLATTTGTSDTVRVPAMIRNAIYGVIAAKAAGVANPTVGILNVDGARQVERALRKLQENGYPIAFAESARADKGSVMRGNDLLIGVPDVMVTDSLTGNVLMKVFSAYTTGGDYEGLGYGYGPGIGEDQERIVMILSRASGAPVAAGAIRYAADLVRGNLRSVVKAEFAAAKAAGLNDILKEFHEATAAPKAEAEVTAPPEKITDHEIGGIDILEIEDAVRALWKTGIFAGSGMGCTGPVVMVAHEDTEAALKALKENGYL